MGETPRKTKPLLCRRGKAPDRSGGISQAAALLAGEEAQRRVGPEDFSGPEHGGGELGVGGAAGEMLRFQRKTAVFLQRNAALARGGAVLQEIAGVELHARLGGIHLHADAALIAGRPCAEALAGTAIPVDDEAVVKSAAHHRRLGETGVDLPPQRFAGAEIHGRTGHRQDLPGGAAVVPALEVAGRIEPELLVQHIAAAIQIEVCMVGQVDDGICIGRHPVVHPQGVVARQDVPHRDLEFPGETVLSVGAFGLHQQGVAEHLDVVDLARKRSVQVVRAVVRLQMVGAAAHAEHSVLDPVGVPPHKRAAAGTARRIKVALVICQRIMPDHNVYRAVFGGDQNVFDHTAVVQHTDLKSAGIENRIFVDLFAVFGHAKRHGTKLCHRARLLRVFCRNTRSCMFHFIMIISQFSFVVRGWF